MGAKVFISCGQATEREIRTGEVVKKWLVSEGYEAYFAIKEQELQDLGNSIISNLVNSDYFLSIDFRRERCKCLLKRGDKCRGSVFANQELALALYLAFENPIFLKQKGVILEGFQKHISFNPVVFKHSDEILKIVQTQVKNKKWNKNYSRSLIAGNPGDTRHKGSVLYGDRLGSRREHIWACPVENRRNRIAQKVVVTLQKIKHSDGKIYDSSDTTPLKWAGFPQYSMDIPPNCCRSIDLFGVSVDNPAKVYLHSCIDISPRKPVIENTGTYFLYYQVFAEDFPLLTFAVKLNLTGDLKTTTANIVKNYINSNLPEGNFERGIKLSDSKVHFTRSENDKSGLDMGI